MRRVSLAIDCYIGVNPGAIDAQLTGGIVHGLNAALYGRQSFVNGAGQSKNFNRSRMIRINEMPQVAVTLMANPSSASRTIPIGGVGELGVPCLAPALANAYAKLIGTRVRTLPFSPTRRWANIKFDLRPAGFGPRCVVPVLAHVPGRIPAFLFSIRGKSTRLR